MAGATAGGAAGSVRRLLAASLVLAVAGASPIVSLVNFPETSGLSSLGQRVLAPLPSPQGLEARLPPLPSPQDLEAIRKVAQLLVMLGEQHSQSDSQQAAALDSLTDLLRTIKPRPARKRKLIKVIPALTGDGGGGGGGGGLLAHASAAGAGAGAGADEIPNDPVQD